MNCFFSDARLNVHLKTLFDKWRFSNMHELHKHINEIRAHRRQARCMLRINSNSLTIVTTRTKRACLYTSAHRERRSLTRSTSIVGALRQQLQSSFVHLVSCAVASRHCALKKSKLSPVSVACPDKSATPIFRRCRYVTSLECHGKEMLQACSLVQTKTN